MLPALRRLAVTLIPKVMSTQHPDNARPAPFADDMGVVKGDGEVDEAVDVFGLGCDEQMWDSEGKEADNHVVRKLLTGYSRVFDSLRLGRDVALTLRVPNPSVERDMRKSMVEALQSVPSAWDTATTFYGEGADAPIQEVILPLTTSARELAMVEAYYRRVIVEQEDQMLLGDQLVKSWVGEFCPKELRVIPLVEDMESLLTCDSIVEEYVSGRDLPHQRVFLARSDPALNYGVVTAELLLKVALQRLHRLEERIGLGIYPIIGAGGVPFRGHLTPLNIDRALTEYPSAHTFTVQSAFKYDYDREDVRRGIAEILAHEKGEPVPIDEARAREVIDKATEEYQSQVQQLAGIISNVAVHVPRRRERRMHVGLFGYGRSLGGGVTLPRAIGFSAALYSIGVPPELLGMACLKPDDLAFVREVYPSLDGDLRAALRFTNEQRVRELLGEKYVKLAAQFAGDIDRVHEGLTGAVWAGLSSSDGAVNVFHYVEEAAQLRHFLG